MDDGPDAVLNYDEAAAFLKLSRRSLERLVAENKVPHVRVTDSSVRFLRESLVDWLRRRSRRVS